MKQSNKLVLEIQEKAFFYFQRYTNFVKGSKGYGLTSDNTKDPSKASIAATGFTLSSYVIGVEYHYISREEALKKVQKTLLTLRDAVPNYRGFFAHFVNIKTAERYKKCEYSTIDTALAVNGIITVASYFHDSQIDQLADAIIKRVDWTNFIHEYNGKTRIYMAYNPDTGGDYTNGHPGYIYHWGMFAEQLMMYVMIAGGGYDPDLARRLYDGFERKKGSYAGYEYYYTPGNDLFVYQYPLAWLDLKDTIDADGISWFDNLAQATLGHRAWCLRNSKKYKTFGRDFFGLTASYTPKGYRVWSCIPNSNNKPHTDGTVAPNAMIGSLPFNEKIILRSIKKMKSVEGLWGEYGFCDAFNFENERWISTYHISIDKGLELLMANAYLSKDVQNAYMRHPIIAQGIEVLRWTKTGRGGKTL